MQIFQRLKDAIALLKGEDLIYANPSFKELFQIKNLPLSIRDILQDFPSEYGCLETKAFRPDGSTFEVEVIFLPYSDSIQQILIRDISQRRAVEKMWLESERLTAMGKLAGEIAHEINNPLGGILLYANLLKEELSPEIPQIELVEKIIKLATRCRIIAKALLNFGQPEDTLEEWIDLNRVLTDMFSLIEDHRLFRNIEINWELAPEIPFVQGNRSQLEQVALNLIINAGEALDGKGSLTFRTFYEASSEMVVLEVEDTGPGIPSERIPKIFEPFFTTKAGGKGTGLGLAICHGIIKRHRGKIEVESTLGKGTLFRVKIPRVQEKYE